MNKKSPIFVYVENVIDTKFEVFRPKHYTIQFVEIGGYWEQTLVTSVLGETTMDWDRKHLETYLDMCFYIIFLNRRQYNLIKSTIDWKCLYKRVFYLKDEYARRFTNLNAIVCDLQKNLNSVTFHDEKVRRKYLYKHFSLSCVCDELVFDGNVHRIPHNITIHTLENDVSRTFYLSGCQEDGSNADEFNIRSLTFKEIGNDMSDFSPEQIIDFILKHDVVFVLNDKKVEDVCKLLSTYDALKVNVESLQNVTYNQIPPINELFRRFNIHGRTVSESNVDGIVQWLRQSKYTTHLKKPDTTNACTPFLSAFRKWQVKQDKPADPLIHYKNDYKNLKTIQQDCDFYDNTLQARQIRSTTDNQQQQQQQPQQNKYQDILYGGKQNENMIFVRGRGRPIQNTRYDVRTQPGKERGWTADEKQQDEDYDLDKILKECRDVRQTCGGRECPQSDMMRKLISEFELLKEAITNTRGKTNEPIGR